MGSAQTGVPSSDEVSDLDEPLLMNGSEPLIDLLALDDDDEDDSQQDDTKTANNNNNRSTDKTKPTTVPDPTPTAIDLTKSILDWDQDDVRQWVLSSGVPVEVATLICDDHGLDGRCLLTITECDLRQPPLSLRRLGDIKRLAISLRALQSAYPDLVTDLNGVGPAASISGTLGVGMGMGIGIIPALPEIAAAAAVDQPDGSDTSEDLQLTYGSGSGSSSATVTRDNSHGDLENYLLFDGVFEPEKSKAILAVLYFLSVTWITSVVMVIVHNRVPDMHRYPPLPDLFLDNVPHIPGAFEMCELCGLVLFIVWMTVLVFHKHRFILVRRMFSMYGTVFLLRCFSMLITSLSVPGRHLECKAKSFESWNERLTQAYYIWTGGGMSIQGVRTCGDYMFSGHTVVLTLMNFFITEYTPPDFYFLHTFTWVLNIFGIFFILAAHEHYSIDVFIAFYISTRLFLYYHTLANNRACQSADGKQRTRIWFPMFYYFESQVIGPVPNEYEPPVRVEHIRNRLTGLSEGVRKLSHKLLTSTTTFSARSRTVAAAQPIATHATVNN